MKNAYGLFQTCSISKHEVAVSYGSGGERFGLQKEQECVEWLKQKLHKFSKKS